MYQQMAQCVRKQSARYANSVLDGEVTGKYVTGTVKSFLKRSITLKKAWYPYILSYEMEVAGVFNK